MSSAWGKSWAGAWGAAWGRIAPAQQPSQVIGGGGRYSDEDIRRLVEEKWDAIDRLRSEREAQRPEEITARTTAEPIELPGEHEPEFFAGHLVGLPAALIPKPAMPDFPAVPLGPTKAELAREARRRNDEEALIMMLAELL